MTRSTTTSGRQKKYPGFSSKLSGSTMLCGERESHLGKILFDFRLKRQITMVELANLAKINHTRCRYFENKKKDEYKYIPFIPEILRIANVLEIESNVLFEAALEERIKAYIYKCYNAFERFKKTGTPDNAASFTTEFNNSYPKRIFKELSWMFLKKRNSFKISRKQLSEKSGLAYKQINEFELGNKRPSFTFLKKMCESLCINIDDAFRIIVKESTSFWEKYYREEYDRQKNKREKEKVEKVHPLFIRSDQYIDTYTSDYLYQRRTELKLTKQSLTKMGVVPVSLQKFENGLTVFGFKDILFFAGLFNDDKDKLFEMSLLDCEKIFRLNYNKKFELYFKYNKICESSRYTDMIPDKWGWYRKHFCPVFLKSSQYLKYQRLKKGWDRKYAAQKIGISGPGYGIFDNGRVSPSFLIISACNKLYGEDIYKVKDMIMEERIAVWNSVYRAMWELYQKVKIDENNKYTKNYELQIPQSIYCDV